MTAATFSTSAFIASLVLPFALALAVAPLERAFPRRAAVAAMARRWRQCAAGADGDRARAAGVKLAGAGASARGFGAGFSPFSLVALDTHPTSNHVRTPAA